MLFSIKKLVTVVILGSSILSNNAFALESRCDGIVNVQAKINEIHQFISDTHDMEKADFDVAIGELNDSVNSLYTSTYNCDPYMDSLLDQMLGAVDTIRNSHNN